MAHALPRESVWDYPRPPKLESVPHRITIAFAGRRIVDTAGAYRVLETSHPPTYYIPPRDISDGVLVPARGRSLCEWKGQASYFDVVADHRTAARAAWTYREPTSAFSALRNCVAFYPAAMDRCTVAGETVQSQKGDFYGGWITSNLDGPFKGGPGTRSW